MRAPGARLAAFFEVIPQFLDGTSSWDRVEDRLGPTPSAVARIAFYRDLMAANGERILGHLYPATRSSLDQGAPGRFREVAARYRRVTRTADWNLNQYGAGLASFLTNDGVSVGNSELADLEWTEYLAAVAPPSSPGELAPILVRLYSHRVDRALSKFRRLGLAGEPVAGPVTLMVHRSVDDHRVRLVQPTREMLLAFAYDRQEIDREALTVAGLNDDALDAARASLERAGIRTR